MDEIAASMFCLIWIEIMFSTTSSIWPSGFFIHAKKEDLDCDWFYIGTKVSKIMAGY